MTKWAKAGARRAVIVSVIAIVGVVMVGGAVAVVYRHSHRTVTDYVFDAPSSLVTGGGTCYGCEPPVDPAVIDPAAGVAAESPGGKVFRGILVTSDAFPDDLRNVRVMPDGYYLEFKDGTVRFVADTAPWAALAPDLEPEWVSYLVREGVIDPT